MLDCLSFQVERLQCQNCLIWAKSDNLARDVIKLRSNVTVNQFGCFYILELIILELIGLDTWLVYLCMVIYTSFEC